MTSDTGPAPYRRHRRIPELRALIFMGISSKTLRIILLLGLACIHMSQASGAEPLYSRGYIDALMDSRFPGLGLRVQAIDANQVTLSTRICLGPWQKRDIASLLKDTRNINVIWAEPALCSPPRSGREQSAAPDSTAKEITESEAIPSMYALPEQVLFAPLLADPREPRFSVSYQRYRISGRKFAAANAAFGEYFGLAADFLGLPGNSQIGLQGAVFTLFNLSTPSSDLVNADYWIGIPVTYRNGPWSFLARIYHQSSHLGDEFILDNPTVKRVNLNYEDAVTLISYEWEKLRIYGGGGYIIHSEPHLARPHLQAGTEFFQPHALRGLDFVAALDVQSSRELGWENSYSFQAGFQFKNRSNRRVRLMFEHFDGHSPNGQFFRERLRYNGIGLYFRF
jgi:hypothetical protein